MLDLPAAQISGRRVPDVDTLHKKEYHSSPASILPNLHKGTAAVVSLTEVLRQSEGSVQFLFRLFQIPFLIESRPEMESYRRVPGQASARKWQQLDGFYALPPPEVRPTESVPGLRVIGEAFPQLARQMVGPNGIASLIQKLDCELVICLAVFRSSTDRFLRAVYGRAEIGSICVEFSQYRCGVVPIEGVVRRPPLGLRVPCLHAPIHMFARAIIHFKLGSSDVGCSPASISRMVF